MKKRILNTIGLLKHELSILIEEAPFSQIPFLV